MIEIRFVTTEAARSELRALGRFLLELGGESAPQVTGTKLPLTTPEYLTKEELGQDADRPPVEAPNENETDSAGTPWDPRIHSETRSLNADKTWRRRRGLPDGLYEAVLAELRGEEAPPPPPEDDDTPPPPVDDTPPPPPPEETPGGVTTFQELVKWINEQTMAKRWTTAQTIEGCKNVGLENLGAFSKQPAKIPEFVELMETLYPVD